MATHDFNFWIVTKPAEDVPGEWVSHCLEVDVVTQGRSVTHALQMAAEAVSMVVAEDMAAGRSPMDRRAPDEFWSELWQVLSTGKPVPLAEAEAAAPKCVAAQLVIHCAIHAVGLRPAPQAAAQLPPVPLRPSSPPRRRAWDVPALWANANAADCVAHT